MRLLLFLAVLCACFGICGESESRPPPGVLWVTPACPVTDQFDSLSMDLKGLHFQVISEVCLEGKTLTITSTLTIEHLSTAYVGGYTCTAAAENIKVESKVLKVLVSGTHGC